MGSSIGGRVLRPQGQSAKEPAPPLVNGVSHRMLQGCAAASFIRVDPSRKAALESAQRESLLCSSKRAPVLVQQLFPGNQ